jgi:hypothetical protein
MKVYVVMADQGDYSDGFNWVSGVFTDKTRAQEAVIAAVARRRVYLQWYKTWIDRTKRIVGPKPEYEGGESFEIFEFDTDKWSAEFTDKLDIAC